MFFGGTDVSIKIWASDIYLLYTFQSSGNKLTSIKIKFHVNPVNTFPENSRKSTSLPISAQFG